jgi:hypothetical protein
VRNDAHTQSEQGVKLVWWQSGIKMYKSMKNVEGNLEQKFEVDEIDALSEVRL